MFTVFQSATTRLELTSFGHWRLSGLTEGAIGFKALGSQCMSLGEERLYAKPPKQLKLGLGITVCGQGAFVVRG